MCIRKPSHISILLACFIFVLNGCEDKTQTVEWFKEHPIEMNKVLHTCKKSGNDTNNCRNVRDADTQIKRANSPIPNLNDLSMPDYPKKE